jgi:hypothetical protein
LWTVRQSIASHWNIFVDVARWIVSLFNKYFLNIKIVLLEKFEDTKGVIRSSKLKKDRQSNGQKNKDKKGNQ